MTIRHATGGRLLAGLTATVMLTMLCAAPVQAMDNDQRDVYRNAVRYFNTRLDNNNASCGAEASAGAALVGSDNVEQAFNYFVQTRGLSPAQAAAIVGNLMSESGVNPLSVQGGSGIGHGIAQWEDHRGSGRWDTTPDRKGLPANVKSYSESASGNGRAVTDLSLQLDFLWHELTNFYSSTLNRLRAATNVSDATYIILNEYEVAGDRTRGGPNHLARTKNANDVLARYGGNLPYVGDAGDSSSAYNCSTGQTGSASCNTTAGQTITGKAAILCEARKFDPFGYLWGGGHGDPEAFMTNFMRAGGYTQPFRQYVDCSGLVTVAIWNAFHVKVYFYTENMGSVGAFREIPISQTQPGDLVYHLGHVEIVAAPGATATFGAHTSNTTPERQISDASGGPSRWTKAYEYIGATTQ